MDSERYPSKILVVCNGELCRAVIRNFNQLLCQTNGSISIIYT